MLVYGLLYQAERLSDGQGILFKKPTNKDMFSVRLSFSSGDFTQKAEYLLSAQGAHIVFCCFCIHGFFRVIPLTIGKESVNTCLVAGCGIFNNTLPAKAIVFAPVLQHAAWEPFPLSSLMVGGPLQ